MSLRAIIDLRRILHGNYMELYAAMHTWKLIFSPCYGTKPRDTEATLPLADSGTKQPKKGW
jgi:hypothetical protein